MLGVSPSPYCHPKSEQDVPFAHTSLRLLLLVTFFNSELPQEFTYLSVCPCKHSWSGTHRVLCHGPHKPQGSSWNFTLGLDTLFLSYMGIGEFPKLSEKAEGRRKKEAQTGSFAKAASLDPYNAYQGRVTVAKNEPSTRRLGFLALGCPFQQSWALDPGRIDAKVLVSQDTIQRQQRLLNKMFWAFQSHQRGETRAGDGSQVAGRIRPCFEGRDF